MILVTEQDWKMVFALAAQAKAAKRHEREMELFYETLDRQQHGKQKAEKKEKETKEIEEAIATSQQVATFNIHLDEYDTKTVEALMANREALDQIRDTLYRMTEEAYVLPDGRRVFKTMDGQRVLDENGKEIGRETIDPEMIGDHHTKWEKYKAGKDAETHLEAERQGLLDFQAKIDAARDRVGKGDITKKELDDLDADLKASAPPSVRQKLGLATPETERDAKPRPDDSSPASQAALADDPSRRMRLQLAPS